MTIPRFVDLMANVILTTYDIDNRARAEVASIVPGEREQELQTIAIGAMMGLRAPTEKEQGEITLIKDLKEEAGLRVIEARADMALLLETMTLEAAQIRLSKPEPAEPDPQDAADRAAAQAVVDAASPAAIGLALLRTPPATIQG